MRVQRSLRSYGNNTSAIDCISSDRISKLKFTVIRLKIGLSGTPHSISHRKTKLLKEFSKSQFNKDIFTSFVGNFVLKSLWTTTLNAKQNIIHHSSVFVFVSTCPSVLE